MTAPWMKWSYQDASGRVLFQHYRYERVPTEEDPRSKGYGYRYMAPLPGLAGFGYWIKEKPPSADAYVYRLPLVLANRDCRLVLTEGERCATAALARRVLASTHHGGAGKFSQSMAESLAGHRGKIVLVADNDLPGALDVCRRYDLLRGVGIPARRLRVCEVVPTHKGADLRDHFEAGYSMRDLKRADLDRLRELATKATAADLSTAGYASGDWSCTPEELAITRNWRRETVRRSSVRPVRATWLTTTRRKGA